MTDGTPRAGDRAAFDADGSPTLHANDVDTATGMHHTLGTGADQAAAGDHSHAAVPDHDHSGTAGDGNTFDAANLTSGASTDGQVLTSDGSGGSAWESLPAFGDMLKSTYDTDNDGKVETADTADTAGDSDTVDGSHAADFAPAVHAHEGADILSGGPITDGYVLTADGAGGSVWEAPVGGSGHTIADEGTPLAAEPTLDFAGAGVTVTDVPGSTKTLVTIPGMTAVEGTSILSGGPVTDGYVLTADGAGGSVWEAIPAPSISMDGLSDATITTPADNDLLTYSSGQWVNANDIKITNDLRVGAGLYVGSLLVDPPADTIIVDSKIYIGDTANTWSTNGLTINQGVEDDEVISLKFSGFAHGMTDITETDTFLLMKKKDINYGGGFIQGLSTAYVGFELKGTCTTSTTSKDATGISAPVAIRAAKKGTTSDGAMGAGDNALLVATGTASLLVVDGSGDSYIYNDARILGGLYVGSHATDPAADTIVVDGFLFVGDTSNGAMSSGVTINQGAADNEILALKSSDVAHGITDVTETDTYLVFKKALGNEGGGFIQGLTETYVGLEFRGTCTTGDTAKSSSANAAIFLTGAKKSGTDQDALGAGENILAVRNYGTDRFIFNADGDLWINGGLTLYKNLGQTVGVTVNHNSATTCGKITMSSFSYFGNAFLVTFAGGGYSTVISDAYVVKNAWSAVNLDKIGTTTAWAVTSFVVSAAVNTGTYTITFTVTHTNTATEAMLIYVTVIPLNATTGMFTLSAS